MRAVEEVHGVLGVKASCEALGLPRATWYRAQARTSRETPGSQGETRPRMASPRSLSSVERKNVLDLVHEPRFVDLSVPQVWATALDEGRYLCSQRTMYRILDAHDEVRERRDQLRRPVYSKPELLATAPNQVWTCPRVERRQPSSMA